jgi:signal peptidase I
MGSQSNKVRIVDGEANTKQSGRRFIRILSAIIWGILPVFAIAMIAAYFGLAAARHVYPPVVPVEGRSMIPLLHFGDLVVLKKAPLGHLHKGDIIAFRTTSDVQQKWNVPGSYVHRIVTVEKGAYGFQFQTKGDNVIGKDPFWTVEQNVVGIYAGKITGAGYPILFVRSRQGKILLGGIVVIMFLYWLLGVFERRRAADAVNVHNLATIVEEARRVTERMEDISVAPRLPPEVLSPRNVTRFESANSGTTDENRETIDQIANAIDDDGQDLQSHLGVMQGVAATTADMPRLKRIYMSRCQLNLP